jgi:hypothetical protein
MRELPGPAARRRAQIDGAHAGLHQIEFPIAQEFGKTSPSV